MQLQIQLVKMQHDQQEGRLRKVLKQIFYGTLSVGHWRGPSLKEVTVGLKPTATIPEKPTAQEVQLSTHLWMR